MKTLYRIYTESRPEYDGVTQELVAETFDAFTVIRGTGFWKGEREASLIIEILGDGTPSEASKVSDLGERIRVANKQEAVLLTRHDVVTMLAGGR